jgi:hypothetical protein
MEDICVGLGYCGSIDGEGKSRHVTDYIPDSGPVTAKQFAEWVMLADGEEPFVGSRFQADFEKLFVQHMGSYTVDAVKLSWFESEPDSE